jgi:hypothetical protein
VRAASREHLWPTAEQELILTAAIGNDDAAVEAFFRWNSGAGDKRHFDSGVSRLLPLVYHRMSQLGVNTAAMPRLKFVHRRWRCCKPMALRVSC